MAATTVFYSGPASKVEIEESPGEWSGSQIDLGECADVSITWEVTGPETMDKSRVQTGGMGKFSAKAMTTNSDNNTALETAQGKRQDIRITVGSASYYIVNNVLLRFGFSAELNDPNKTTTFDLMAQGWTDEPDDFVTLPGA